MLSGAEWCSCEHGGDSRKSFCPVASPTAADSMAAWVLVHAHADAVETLSSSSSAVDRGLDGLDGVCKGL